MEPIILASSSPRRQRILKLLNIPFQVIMPNIDESISPHLEIGDVPELFAREKLAAVLHSISEEREIPWILSADTVIIYRNTLFGKPQTQEEAKTMLQTLQGKTHTVRTVVALYNGKTKSIATRTSDTEVTFRPMSESEIDWYIETGEWHGVAGAYRIQELASCFIEKIKGSPTGVEGLPIAHLYDMLKTEGYSLIE